MSVPLLLETMLLCDVAVSEVGTLKKTLVGVYNVIWCNAFPASHPKICLYYLVSGYGDYDLCVEVSNDLSGQEPPTWSSPTFRVNISDRLLPVDGLIRIASLDLPSPGKYEFRLRANGLVAGTKTFWVCQRELGPAEFNTS